MLELPMLRNDPVCPAALPIAGVSGATRGVVCRAMQQDAERDAGLRMTPRALEIVRDAPAGIYLNLKSDPATVVAFCHGDAVPVLSDDDDKLLARASYTRCPVWQAARNARLEGRDSLVVDREPEPVAMGVASHETADPWAAARAGLDELAPARAA